MLYAVSYSRDETSVDIIDTQTLERRTVSMKELYDMYCSGITVRCITTLARDINDTIIDIHSLDTLKWFKGFVFDTSESLKTCVEYDEYIPITILGEFHDFDVVRDDFICKHIGMRLHIWYLGEYVSIPQWSVSCIFMENGTIVGGSLQFHDGNMHEVVRDIRMCRPVSTVPMSRSEFMRMLLLM